MNRVDEPFGTFLLVECEAALPILRPGCIAKWCGKNDNGADVFHMPFICHDPGRNCAQLFIALLSVVV
jgi:hypothetical protein